VRKGAHIYNLKYVKLSEIEPAELLPLLNKQTTRNHLIEHELFDINGVEGWIQSKLNVDAAKGCKIRAIMADKQLAGWCGIQFEEGHYEIAAIIDNNYWGMGQSVFREIMIWAKELGHTTILIHLLHTRPEYKFLRKMSKKVYQSKLMGSKFTTYELGVS
jgi:hypothetical protein